MNIFSLVCVPRLSCCRGLRISSTDETRGCADKRLQYVICMPSGVWFHELKSSLTFIWLFSFVHRWGLLENFSSKFSGLFPKKSLKLAISPHYSFGLDPLKQTGMKREIFRTNETELNVCSNNQQRLSFKKGLKIVRGIQTDLAKSNVSVFSYSAVSEYIFN